MVRWQAVAVALVASGCGRRNFNGNDADVSVDVLVDASSTYATAVMAEGPLAYWRFDEATTPIVLDSSGNGVTGIYTAVLLGRPGAIAGDPSQSVELAAADSGIAFGDRFGFAGNVPFSIELWAKPSAGGGLLAGKFDYDATGMSFPGWFVYCDNGMGARRAGLNLGAPPIPTGVYSYVVLTYDGVTAALFIDGTMTDQRGNTNPLPTVTSAFTLGRMEVGNWAPFQGLLDEVAIYDHNLSPTVIAGHYAVARP